MKTVVTGGAGLIGSHLVKRLVDEGREVVVADDFSRGSRLNLLDLGVSLNPRKTDLRDFAQASKALEDAKVIFHLAARVGSVDTLHGNEMAELEALQTNLIIDANVFRACLENKVEKLIYASSVSVYPLDLQHSPEVVLSESELQISDKRSMTLNPEGGYGWAKLLGEIQLSWMKNIRVGIARIFNVYGENEDPGKKDAHVVPALIRKAILYPEEEFLVWGDGKQARDFLYVGDCVDALLKLEAKASSPPVVVNIGSDKAIAISELAEKIAELSGKRLKPVYNATKLVGPLSRTADMSRAKKLLDWEPRIPLEEGLRRTYLWAERRLKEKYVS